ncbi:MAG: hypothetical protein FD143_3208 [Ignavibacteria bacterium]|nr:MAG: hypothetical protein FD143_3208 [Ignavibacteria bacterium]KAF0153942.1 MAG: hypothetical protein FD188_3321 [Ignavibacteria bacterium]
MKKKIIIIVITLLSVSCSSKKEERNVYESLPLYNHTIIKKDSLFLLQNDKVFVGQISNMVTWKDYVLISDFNNHTMIFDKKLNHIKTVGTEGTGPGEFTNPPTPVLGTNNFILLNRRIKKYFEYDERFNFISEKKLPPKFDFFPINPIRINNHFITFVGDPSVYGNRKKISNINSLYIFDENFNYTGKGLYKWDDIYNNEDYFAYTRNNLFVRLTLYPNGFFATQPASNIIAHFDNDLNLIKEFRLEPKYSKDPPIESDILKTQQSVETVVRFGCSMTSKLGFVYEPQHELVAVGYTNLKEEFFYKRTLMIGDHYLQVFDKNYNCIFDGPVPGLVAFTLNGLIYILAEEKEEFLKFIGYELVKK